MTERPSSKPTKKGAPARHFASLPHHLRIDEPYERARGCRLTGRTAEGKPRVVLDLTGGNGDVLLGHHPPAVVAAARRALTAHTTGAVPLSRQQISAELCERLATLVGEATGRPFVTTLATSSSEAVELALHQMELARRQRVTAIERDRQRNLVLVRRQIKAQRVRPAPNFLRDVATFLKIETPRSFDEAVFELTRYAKDVARRPGPMLALTHAYHGRTTGALAVSYDPDAGTSYARHGLRPEFLALDDPDRLHERMKRNIEVWYAAADKIGCPLVVDESRCGLGWTGEVLASSATGVVADYYVLGGALGGGLAKVGALLVDADRFVDWSVRTPAAALAGDDGASAVAMAVLDGIGGTFMTDVAASGERLLAALTEVVEARPDVYRGIRGRGHLLGLTVRFLHDSPCPGVRVLSEQNLLAPIIAGHLLHEEGIRVLPCVGAPHTLRIQPPSGLTAKDVARVARAFLRVADVIRRGNFALLVRYLVGLEGRRRSTTTYGAPLPEWHDHPYARKVAFVGHTISAETFPDWDPSLVELTLDERDRLAYRLQRFLRPSLALRRNVRSATGEVVTLHFLGLSVSSRNIVEAYQRRDTGWLVDLVHQAIDRAVALGCSVIGFGGFTALLTKNCRDIVDDRIAMTSGISFTVVAGLEAIASSCRALGLAPGRVVVGAVGAETDLCRNYVAVLTESAAEVVLLGSEDRRSRLEQVAAELYFQAFRHLYRNGTEGVGGLAAAIADTAVVRRRLHEPFPAQGTPQSLGPLLLQELRDEWGGDRYLTFATSPDELRRCDVVVAGAPRGAFVIRPEHLKDGPVVVCDIALPASVHPDVHSARPDVPVLMGGLVRLPNNPDFVVPGIPLPPGTTFGCMAETMLLGLTGIMEDYSVGQLTPIKIKKIHEIAAIHGFELGHSKNIPSM